MPATGSAAASAKPSPSGMRTRPRAGDEFSFGLELLLDGLERLRDRG